MKSFSERHNGGAEPSPVVLPPPDHFGDQRTFTNNHEGENGGRYPIDTSTAKAIIDTYSGNLFSRSTNYYSFRENQLKQQLDKFLRLEQQQKTQNNCAIEGNDNVGAEEDSLEVYHRRDGSSSRYTYQNRGHVMMSPPLTTMPSGNEVINGYDFYEDGLNYHRQDIKTYNSQNSKPNNHASNYASSLSKKTRTESVV